MDATHIPELAQASAYPVLFASYEAIPGVRQLLADIRPVSPIETYGTKSTTIIGGSDMAEREDGAGVERDRMEKGWTWYAKVRGYGKELFLSNDFISANSSAQVEAKLTEWAGTVGQNLAYQKEKLIADLMQKGTLSAGSALFDGSFVGEADPYPTFIYDGQPLFSAAHPLIVGADTFANFGVSRTLTSANLTLAKVEMMQTSAVDDRGNRIMNMPRYIVVPPAMEATAKVLLESMNLPGSANNDANIHRGTLDIIVNPFLTDTESAAAWWLLSGNLPCLRMYDQGAPRLKAYAVEERDGTVIQLLNRFGANAVDWRGMQCNNKAVS
jgi:hypothetical protein